jgi:hypothetical protein
MASDVRIIMAELKWMWKEWRVAYGIFPAFS